MLDIRDIEGKVVFSTPINKGCKRKYTLMQEDYISLVFSVEEPIYFRLGDSIYDGQFEITDLVSPRYNNSTAGYDYEVKFDAYYWKWKNKKFFYAPEFGARESAWSLTANLDTQLSIIIKNLNYLNYTYKGKAFEFSVDSTVKNVSKPLRYDNLNIIEALNLMAQTWECEWWVTDNIIHLGRCEYGTPVDFELNNNVEKMNRNDGKRTFATRVYAFGSEKNIPKNYRPVDSSITTNGIVQKRLMLPVGTPYIDAYEGMIQEEAIEQIVIFDDVYPKLINKASKVEVKESSVKDKETQVVSKLWTYFISDESLKFNKKYILPDTELRLVFQSGALNGLDFAISFANKSFEIIRNEDYGRLLPDDILKPKVGDEFVLYGYDTKYVSDAMLPKAELELKERAIQFVEKSKIDPSTYECSMMSDYMFNGGNIRTFDVGDRVRLINKAYFKDSRASRIIGYEYPLDMPYDSPRYIVGETASYSHLEEIKADVKELTYKEKIFSGSSSNVYVIGQHDSTRPTDRNVLSSLCSLNTFLRKDQEDSTEHLITFLAGLKLGAKHSLDKNGNAALNNIKSGVIESLKAKFHELESTKLNSSEGVIDTLTALTLFVKNLADVQKLDVKETATILKTIIKGTLSSPKFVSGILGEGFRIAKSSDGSWSLEIDNLIVRKVFQVFELLIQEVKHQGGVVVHSPAGGKITKITDGGSYWKCEVESADTFFKDDLVLCQKFTGKNIKRYWRLATSAGDGFVNLSKTDCEENSAIPEVDDEIATLGNKTNTARQSAYLISVVGVDAPYTAYYSGINSYSLKGKEHTRIGNLEGVVSPAFGPLKGSGALLENAYIQGIVKLQNGKTVETVISETSSKLSSDIGKVKTELKGDISKSKEETKGEINSSVSSVRNELNSTIAKAEKQFNTGINQTKTELSSNISSVKEELEGKINTDIQVSKESITKQITQSKQEAEAASKAYTDAQDKAKLTQAKSYVDGKVATEQKRAIEDVNAKLTAAKKYADAADAKLKTEQQAYADGKVTATEEKLLQTASDNLAAAKAYAEAQDKALKVKTEAYADGKITAEEKRAIDDANAKLAAAKKYAEAQDNLLKIQQEAYADGKVTEAEKRAIADATNKVNAAKKALENQINKVETSIKKEITTVEQRFQIAEGQINGKITETTQLVNEAKKTNGETKKTLEQTTARINQFDITAKKFEGTLGEITKKQGEVENSIVAVKATANNLNASVNSFKETEKQIKATANKIEATHKGIVLEASEKSAKKAINDLEIGGKNLLKNSSKGWKNSSYPTATLYFAEQLKNGERFSIRIYGKLNDNSNNNWSIYNSGGNLSVLTISRSSYNKIGGYYEGTGVWKTNKDVKNTHINIYGIPNSKLENSIDKVMMVRGNKPIDWTPAPEDIDTQFTETKTSIKALNNQLVAEVSKTNGISKELTTIKQNYNSFKIQVKTDISGAINKNNEVIKSSFEMHNNTITMMGKAVDVLAELKVGDETVITQNGYVNTKLIQANSITAKMIDVQSLESVRIRTGNLEVLEGATIAKDWRIGSNAIYTEQKQSYHDPIVGRTYPNVSKYSTSMDSESGGIISKLSIKGSSKEAITQLSPLGLYTQMGLQHIELSDFNYPLEGFSAAGAGIVASIRAHIGGLVFGVSGYAHPTSSIEDKNFYGGFFQNLLVVGRTSLRGGGIGGFGMKTVVLSDARYHVGAEDSIIIAKASRDRKHVYLPSPRATYVGRTILVRNTDCPWVIVAVKDTKEMQWADAVTPRSYVGVGAGYMGFFINDGKQWVSNSFNWQSKQP